MIPKQPLASLSVSMWPGLTTLTRGPSGRFEIALEIAGLIGYVDEMVADQPHRRVGEGEGIAPHAPLRGDREAHQGRVEDVAAVDQPAVRDHATELVDPATVDGTSFTRAAAQTVTLLRNSSGPKNGMSPRTGTA